MSALIWLIVAILLIAAETMVGDLSLLMLGGGALSAAATSWAFDWPLWSEGLIFLFASVLLLFLVRPALRRRLGAGPQLPALSGPAGKEALVLAPVTDRDGRVKVDGEVWSARAMNRGDRYAAGDTVTVMNIDGATAVVWKDS